MQEFLESVLHGILREFLIDNWFWILLVGLLLVLKVVELLFFRKGKLEKEARRIHEDQQRLYGGGFRWAHAELSQLPDVDLSFYEQADTELATLGFQPVGDVEMLHITEAYPKMRTALRIYGSGHGHVFAAAYHLRVRGAAGFFSLLMNRTRNFRVFEFETAVSDGRFVTTTNADKMLVMSSPESISRNAMPRSTTATELLAAHIEHVKGDLAGAQGVSPIYATNLEQIMDLQKRQFALEKSHRETVGAVSDDELQRIVPGLEPGQRETVVAEAQRLRPKTIA